MPVVEAYANNKTAAGLLDYDDLIDRTSELLADPGAAWVLYKLDGGIDPLLLDEVQDSAPAQWRIALLDGAVWGVPIPRSVTGWPMYVLQNLLDQIGASPPKTTNDFTAICKALTNPNANKWAIGVTTGDAEHAPLCDQCLARITARRLLPFGCGIVGLAVEAAAGVQGVEDACHLPYAILIGHQKVIIAPRQAVGFIESFG